MPPGGGFVPSAPMAPVPGLRDEGNAYRPVQREDMGERERPYSYHDQLADRKLVSEVTLRI